MNHLVILPILIPLVGAALSLFVEHRRYGPRVQRTVSFSALVLLACAVAQLFAETRDGATLAYLLGDWPSRLGIALVADRLSVWMLVTTVLLAGPCLLHACSGWDRRAPHFHALYQFQLVGLNGAFLTGDIFNLFVFFEILLAASYGLLLHGSGQLRVRAGLHYIAINLAASLLFLIGVALIYGVTGTLNMAHLANLISAMPGEDRPLLHAGVAILAIAFLVKAGSWPLNFWLPTAYMAAAAPVGAMFAIMTKVGVYAILRLAMLLFGETGGASAGFGAGVLILLGMATILFGLLGILASQSLGRMAAHSVLVSSGTVLGITGFALAGGGQAMLAGALYYMVGSVLATGALFLLIEPMNREDGGIAAMLALTADAYGIDDSEIDEVPDVGLAIPGTMTVLGICFALCVLMLAGLPPLPGFIGKIAMIQPLIEQSALPAGFAWSFVALLILSGFATLIGMARIGIQTFWANDVPLPRVLAFEIAPIIALLVVLSLISFKAEAMLRYTIGTAHALHDTAAYAYGVFATPRAADRPDDEGEAQE